MKIDTVDLEKRGQAWEQAGAAREQQKRKEVVDTVLNLSNLSIFT